MNKQRCTCKPVDVAKIVARAVNALTAKDCERLWNDTFVTYQNSKAFKTALIKALT